MLISTSKPTEYTGLNYDPGEYNLFTYQETTKSIPVVIDPLQSTVERMFKLQGYIDTDDKGVVTIDKGFVDLLDVINNFELSVMLTPRTIDNIEDTLLGNTDQMMLVLNMNSCLTFIMTDDEKMHLAVKFQNLVNSMSPSNYKDSPLSNSGAYITQLEPGSRINVEFIMNTYYKVILLLAIYSFAALNNLVALESLKK